MSYMGKVLPTVALTSADIADDAVISAKIADDAVTAAKIATNAVDTAEIAADAVEASELANNAVDTAAVADNAVTLAKMAGLVRGKIIVGDASGDPSALTVGSANQVLTSDGTDAAWAAAAAGGKVLQVVTLLKTDTFTTTSTSLVDITGFTLNITPSAATSKILVLSTLNGSQGVAANRAYVRLMRDSTAIFIGDAAGSRDRVSGSFSAAHQSIGSPTIGSTLLDSPNTTSAVTYKWQIVLAAGSGTVYFNRTHEDNDESGQGRFASTITLMEIGA